MLEYILSALDDAVLAYNIDEEKYMFVSPAIEKVTGYKPEDFKQIPHLLRDMIHPDDLPGILAARDSIQIPGEQELTFRIILPNKEIRWIHGKRVQLIHDDTKQRIGISILRNVTEAVIYKTSSEQKVWFLSSLINSVGALVFRVDKNGTYTYVNDIYNQKLGYKKEDLLGKSMMKVVHPDDAALLLKMMKNALANPGKVFHFTHRKITANGDVRCIVTDAIAVIDRDGNVAEIQGVGLDITDQEKAKQEITWTKNNLESLINNTYDLIWSIDRDKNYVSLNKAFKSWIRHVYHTEPGKGLPANSPEIYPVEIVDEWNLNYERALNGETFTMDYREINPATGKEIYFEVAFNPIKLEGRIIGVGCFAHDITDQVLTHQAILDQNEKLRQIASLSSHELRRPVATLMGLVDVLDKEDITNPENKSIINHIDTVANELDNVIRLIVNKAFVDNVL